MYLEEVDVYDVRPSPVVKGVKGVSVSIIELVVTVYVPDIALAGVIQEFG